MRKRQGKGQLQGGIFGTISLLLSSAIKPQDHAKSKVIVRISRIAADFEVTCVVLGIKIGEAPHRRSNMLLAFHKPFGIIAQFTTDGSPNGTLAECGFPKGVYPIGRLDADSEGLLPLSDDPELNERL